MEAVARLRNYPTSPRKMRLLVDVIRGMKVENALNFLKFNSQHPSTPLEKLLKSAISNWQVKNESEDIDDLIVKTVFVDSGRMLKRMLPAPQGRAYRVRKRSNHVTIVVDQKNPAAAMEATTAVEEAVVENNDNNETENK
jgi:large subunit ribosomal protein L22